MKQGVDLQSTLDSWGMGALGESGGTLAGAVLFTSFLYPVQLLISVPLAQKIGELTQK